MMEWPPFFHVSGVPGEYYGSIFFGPRAGGGLYKQFFLFPGAGSLIHHWRSAIDN